MSDRGQARRIMALLAAEAQLFEARTAVGKGKVCDTALQERLDGEGVMIRLKKGSFCCGVVCCLGRD